MARTALDLTPEEVTEYRWPRDSVGSRSSGHWPGRRKRAWKVARAAVRLLKGRFGATRVVVFSSLVHEGCFTLWSDVDIAAWGIHLEDTFRAIGAMMDLDSEIEVNLVDVEVCRPSLLAMIERKRD